MVALIITDAAFGVVSRVVPQLNIFAVGFPAKMIVGLTLLGASLPFVSGFIGDRLSCTGCRRCTPCGSLKAAMAERQDREGDTQEREEARKKGQVAKLHRHQRRRDPAGRPARALARRPGDLAAASGS